MKYQFKAKIQQVFADAKAYSENRKQRRVSFECSGNSVSYEALTALSKILGTSKINFSGDRQEFQYGTGTWDYDEKGEIEATEASFAKG